MSQIIVIEPEEKIRELFSINISTYLGTKIIPKSSAEEVLELMAILPDIGLIITRDKLGEENTGQIIADYIKENGAETQIIVIGKLPEGAQDFAVSVADTRDWKEVVTKAASMLGITKEALEKKVRPDYIPMPVTHFLHLDTSCCDVYIRIKKSAEEFQFVKRIHQGDTFSKAAIQKYIDQGLKQFYVPVDMQENFTTFVSNQLLAKLDAVSGASVDERLEVLSNGYEVATREVLRLGFNSSTVQLTDGIINGMVETLKTSKEMSGLLHKIINSKSSYIYQHSHMTSVVASEVLNNLGQGDKKAHELMAFCAFFHNISLVDNEELSKITRIEELEQAKLGDEEWDLVFNHALEASVLVTQHPEAPKGASEVIKCHHGANNGKGFTTGAISDLSEHSRVFVVACEFVKELLDYREKGGKPAPLINEMKERFKDPLMDNVLVALEQTLKKRSA